MADKVSKFIFPVKTGNDITNKEFDVGGSGGNTFVGTTAEWEALTTEQQNAYDCRVLTDDDLDTKNVIDNLTSDSSTDALSAKQGKVLKGLADTTQEQVSNSDDAYDPTKPYKVGDLCIHNNVLYRCITACSAGSWDVNQSCFTPDTLVNVVDVLSQVNIANLSGLSCIKIGKVVTLEFSSTNSTNLTAYQWTTIATLPAGYRPSGSRHAIVALTAGANQIGVAEVQSNGSVRIYNPTAEDKQSIWGSITYLIF